MAGPRIYLTLDAAESALYTLIAKGEVESPVRVRVHRELAAQLTGSEYPEDVLGYGRVSVGVGNDFILCMQKESDPPVFYMGEC